MQGGAEMEIAVMTSPPAEWYMDVDACHQVKGLKLTFGGQALLQNGI